MMSIGAKITSSIIRLYTYKYRKNHLSLSRSVKFKNKKYNPPKGFSFEIKEICGSKFEILSPNNPNETFSIVHFHGGGSTQKMNSMYRKVAERLSKLSNADVYSIDYKTGENLVYPSLHDECYTAYGGLISTILKGKKIIAVGDSFGANIILSTCLKLRDKNLPLPEAIVSISCCIDLAATGSSYEKNCYRDPLYSLPKNQSFKEHEKDIRRIIKYVGNTSPYDKFLSPAYAEFDGFPQVLIQCGEAETSESDNDILYEKLLKCGIKAKMTKYYGMWHDFQYITPFLKESKQAWHEISEFILSIMQ
ncbi:MAG: alpha/beta hydrolase [Clostridia bacterium]|nr:alpha/beta hydrolase [Clostridia bacterium]